MVVTCLEFCFRLEPLASSRRLNLQHCDVEAIASHLLPEKLPSFKAEEVIWQPPSGDADPSEQWLRLLWRKLEVSLLYLMQCARDGVVCTVISIYIVQGFNGIDFLYGWALVPTDDGRLVSLQPATRSRVVRHADRPWDPELAETCAKLGCRYSLPGSCSACACKAVH